MTNTAHTAKGQRDSANKKGIEMVLTPCGRLFFKAQYMCFWVGSASRTLLTYSVIENVQNSGVSSISSTKIKQFERDLRSAVVGIF